MALLVALVLDFAAECDPMKRRSPCAFDNHSSCIRCRLEWQNRLFDIFSSAACRCISASIFSLSCFRRVFFSDRTCAQLILPSYQIPSCIAKMAKRHKTVTRGDSSQRWLPVLPLFPRMQRLRPYGESNDLRHKKLYIERVFMLQ